MALDDAIGVEEHAAEGLLRAEPDDRRLRFQPHARHRVDKRTGRVDEVDDLAGVRTLLAFQDACTNPARSARNEDWSPIPPFAAAVAAVSVGVALDVGPVAVPADVLRINSHRSILVDT